MADESLTLTQYWDALVAYDWAVHYEDDGRPSLIGRAEFRRLWAQSLESQAHRYMFTMFQRWAESRDTANPLPLPDRPFDLDEAPESDSVIVTEVWAPFTGPFGSITTEDRKFRLGDRVRKIKGSSWQGKVVGFYRTSLTPEGYCVESEREPGSVQIYPLSALELVP